MFLDIAKPTNPPIAAIAIISVITVLKKEEGNPYG